jgi:hypothetical protein
MSLQQQYTWPFPPRRRTQPLQYICISENKKSYLEVDGPLAIEEGLSPSTSQEAMLKKSIAVQNDGTSDGCDDHSMLLYLEEQRI